MLAPASRAEAIVKARPKRVHLIATLKGYHLLLKIERVRLK